MFACLFWYMFRFVIWLLLFLYFLLSLKEHLFLSIFLSLFGFSLVFLVSFESALFLFYCIFCDIGLL